MPQQFIYTNATIPDTICLQAVSFLRIQWPDGFQKENQLRDWITHDNVHPVYFVLAENDILISLISVVWKELVHAGKKYKTYGLSGVFTFPSFRNQGYGSQLIKAAKEYIEKTDGDIALFTTTDANINFYKTAGFIHMKDIKLLKGNPKKPLEDGSNVFMLFLSEKRKAARKDFETRPIYFGTYIW